MLSVKQDGIKYHFFILFYFFIFLSLWYDLDRDRTSVSKTIDKHSTHKANGLVKCISEVNIAY